MRKIKAYTLMEVTVAMLLTAICMTICYTAYGIIGNYYAVFQQKNQSATEVLALKHVLERDFLKSKIILKSEQGFEVIGDSVTIDYFFSTAHVIRQWNTVHVDTFKLKPSELFCYFEGKEVFALDTLDQIRFKLGLTKDITAPIQVHKIYSAENLFH